MRVSWITFGAPERRGDGSVTSTLASLRYRVLAPILATSAHQHQIVPLGPEAPESRREKALNADVLILSKSFDPANEDLARRAQAKGIPVVFDVCDNHYRHPQHGAHYRAMTALADHVVCSTEAMRDVARPFAQAPLTVIQDPYEGPRGAPRFAPGERLRLLWFGHPSNLDSLRGAFGGLGEYAARRAVSLSILTTPGEALAQEVAEINHRFGPALQVTVEPWSLEAQWSALAACDAVVIPSLQTDQKRVKSANRMVEALWAGRPVVAQPLPAFMPFAAWTPIRTTLLEGLTALEAEPEAWPGRIEAAQAHIAQVHTPAVIGRSWETVFRGVRRAGAPVKLNLGCGDKILPGFVNVDVVESRAGMRPDVICDLHQLTPFADDSADEIMAIHVVEHFWRWEVVDVLKEWVRVLKPGGRLILECPNLISACQAVLADPDNATLPGKEGQRSMWVLYGDPQWRDPLMVHRWGYTPRSLAQVMIEAGLGEIRQEPAQYKLREPRDMRITGVKPR